MPRKKKLVFPSAQGGFKDPTHWMPLPEPPKGETP